MRPFRDRVDAGQLLAKELTTYTRHPDALVLALPRGGVVVGFEVARALGLPLEVFVVRKLGVPGQEELAMGAIASGGVRILNLDVVSSYRISPDDIEFVVTRELQELRRREQLYRGTRPWPKLQDRTIILVDDGIATGSTVRAAVEALRRIGATRIIVATPLIAETTAQQMQREGLEIVAVVQPHHFPGVGSCYLDFSQTQDDEVCRLLEEAERAWQPPRGF